MKIAVIGKGNVGKALALGWKKVGHQVVFGATFSGGTEEGISILSNQEAINQSETIVFATPPSAVIGIAESARASLASKLLIDATNSVFKKPEPYTTAFEALQKITGANRIVKCFNSTGFENMENPRGEFKLDNTKIDFAADMFMAGGDEESKKTVEALALDLGFSACYDFGGNDKIDLLEQFAFSWINLAIMQGVGRNMIFKVIKR